MGADVMERQSRAHEKVMSLVYVGSEPEFFFNAISNLISQIRAIIDS